MVYLIKCMIRMHTCGFLQGLRCLDHHHASVARSKREHHGRINARRTAGLRQLPQITYNNQKNPLPLILHAS